MEMDKSILLQKQIRDNSDDLRSEFLDMKNWEEQMKRADTEIRKASGDEILPPVRRKKKAAKESTKSLNKENAAKSKRIKSSDYAAWEKYDAETACKALEGLDHSDEQEEEPLTKEELEKSHAEATKHKEMGNDLVKKAEWAQAVGCYSKAIQIFPHDAVFYANRALCNLKMDNLYSAEADCTTAIQLDEFYVKAYHRRATARMSLKQYPDAARDINAILKLEPSNKEAKIMLARVNKSIESSKPLILTSTPDETKESEAAKNLAPNSHVDIANDQKKSNREVKDVPIEGITEKKSEEKAEQIQRPEENHEVMQFPKWLPEVPEDVDVVKIITKPPHERSKKPLITVPIKEIEFGAKPKNLKEPPAKHADERRSDQKTESIRPSESELTESTVPEAPKTAVQFFSIWGKNTSLEFRHKYFKKIPAERIPVIFQDSMESNTFSDILKVLRLKFTTQNEPVFDCLRYLSQVKRFRTLTMFMTQSDKEDLRQLFEYAKKTEGQTDNVIEDLRVKYEI